MANEIFPVRASGESDDLVENVAMPLFDLRDSTMLSYIELHRAPGPDAQSQILLSYSGFESDDRVFSTSLTSMNVLGLYKFMQAFSRIPTVVGILVAIQCFFMTFAIELVRATQSMGCAVLIVSFFISYGAVLAAISAGVIHTRRNARPPTDKLSGFFSGLVEPDHIAISPQGLNLQWSAGPTQFSGSVMPWSNIALAYMEEHEDEASKQKYEVLCMRDNFGHSMRLDCRAFASDVLVTALQKRAPWSIKAPPMVLTVQPPQLRNFQYLASWGMKIARSLSKPDLKRVETQPGLALQGNRYTIIETLPLKRFGTEHIARVATQNQSKTQKAVRAINGTELIENTTLVLLKEFVLPAKLGVENWYWLLVRFEDEVRRVSQINNNNIARWLDVFMENGSLFVVTEYDASPNLRKIVGASGCLAEQRVRELALEMCEILNHLHQLEPPYVHGDFTPDSLVLTESNYLKLNSFQIGANFLPSKLNSYACDRRYAAPEILSGFASGQADIYSLGCTLAYLLIGEDPTPFQQCDVKSKKPEISQAFSDIVKQATSLQPNARFDSVASVKAAILDLANSETSLILL